MNGAEALLEVLVNGEVDVCFANPGTSEMPSFLMRVRLAG